MQLNLNGVLTVSFNQQWGLCFDTVKTNTNTSAQAAQEAWDNVTSSSDRSLIEGGYYCNAVKNALVVAAQCVKPCTNDNKDYFGREQLTTFCETGLNVTTFATIASFSTAQIAYSCSQPPLNCTGLIDAQLLATLNSQGSSAMISLSGYIAFILVLISMFAAT